MNVWAFCSRDGKFADASGKRDSRRVHARHRPFVRVLASVLMAAPWLVAWGATISQDQSFFLSTGYSNGGIAVPAYSSKSSELAFQQFDPVFGVLKSVSWQLDGIMAYRLDASGEVRDFDVSDGADISLIADTYQMATAGNALGLRGMNGTRFSYLNPDPLQTATCERTSTMSPVTCSIRVNWERNLTETLSVADANLGDFVGVGAFTEGISTSTVGSVRLNTSESPQLVSLSVAALGTAQFSGTLYLVYDYTPVPLPPSVGLLAQGLLMLGFFKIGGHLRKRGESTRRAQTVACAGERNR